MNLAGRASLSRIAKNLSARLDSLPMPVTSGPKPLVSGVPAQKPPQEYLQRFLMVVEEHGISRVCPIIATVDGVGAKDPEKRPEKRPSRLAGWRESEVANRHFAEAINASRALAGQAYQSQGFLDGEGDSRSTPLLHLAQRSGAHNGPYAQVVGRQTKAAWAFLFCKSTQG